MANTSIKQRVSKNFQNYRWLLHLLFWTTLIGICYYQISNPAVKSQVKTTAALVLTIKLTILFILSYTFQFLVLPLYRQSSKIVFWFTLLALLLAAFILQIVLIKLVVENNSPSAAGQNLQFLALASRNFSAFIFLFSFFIAFYYFVDIYDQQKEIQQLEKFKTQKIALESSFLKSQVNPHFLFNTLNNIYALSLKKSDQTYVIIERLESLLHYMLYDCKADLVPLKNEFNFTNSYIALEKLRHKEDQCAVTVQITGHSENRQIAPLLLINFLENAFKHGTKATFGKSWITMDIKVDAKFMHFNLQNSKPFNAVGQAITEYKGGIGLRNVRRRLEILYPNRHKLVLNNAKDRFEVDLVINF